MNTLLGNAEVTWHDDIFLFERQLNCIVPFFSFPTNFFSSLDIFSWSLKVLIEVIVVMVG